MTNRTYVLVGMGKGCTMTPILQLFTIYLPGLSRPETWHSALSPLSSPLHKVLLKTSPFSIQVNGWLGS